MLVASCLLVNVKEKHYSLRIESILTLIKSSLGKLYVVSMGNFLKKTLLADQSSISSDSVIPLRVLPERFRDNPFYFEKLQSYYEPSLSDNGSDFVSTRSRNLSFLSEQYQDCNEDLVPTIRIIHDEPKNETRQIIDYAAKEILMIGKKQRQRINAYKMSVSLRRMKKKDERIVLEYCVKLYTQSSFLYRACHRDLNDYYSPDDNQLFNYRKLLQLYIDLYGKPYIGEIYRGAVLSEMQLKLHLANDLNTMWYSPTFLSASKSRKVAEVFGNVLMIIHIQQSDDNNGKAVDISGLSAVPDEEEVLLTPNYRLFKMKQPEFNPILEKIIIYLASTRSSISQDDDRSHRSTKLQRDLTDQGSDTCSFTWNLYLHGPNASDSSSEDEPNLSSECTGNQSPKPN